MGVRDSHKWMSDSSLWKRGGREVGEIQEAPLRLNV